MHAEQYYTYKTNMSTDIQKYIQQEWYLDAAHIFVNDIQGQQIIY